MQNYKKNFVTRTLAWVLTVVMVVTMLPMGVFAATPLADWEETTNETDFWPTPAGVTYDDRGLSTSPWPGYDIGFDGFSTDGDGRTVINLKLMAYSTANPNTVAAKYNYQYAQFKFSPELEKIIDFGKTFVGTLRYQNNPDKSTAADRIKFSNSTPSQKGVYQVKMEQLVEGGSYESRVWNLPVKIVLNDGVTLDQINKDYLIQSRFLNLSQNMYYARINRKVKDDAAMKLNGYNAYTFSTIVPGKSSVRKGEIANRATYNDANSVGNAQQPPLFTQRTVIANYDEETSKLYIFHGALKQTSGYNTLDNGNIGYRVSFDSRFKKYLKTDPVTGAVGYVSIRDGKLKSYSTTKTAYLKMGDANTVGDTTVFQLGTNDFQKTEGITNKTVVNDDIHEVYLHSAATLANLFTIAVFDIDQDKLMKESFTDPNKVIESFAVRTSFVLDTQDTDFNNVQTNGWSKYSYTVPNEITIPANGKITITTDKLFGSSLFGIDAGGDNYITKAKQLLVNIGGDEGMTYLMPSNTGEYRGLTVVKNNQKQREFEIPFREGQTLKEGQTIDVYIPMDVRKEGKQFLTDNAVNLFFKDNTGTELAKGKITSDQSTKVKPARTMENGDKLTGVVFDRTLMPVIDEIFTDSTEYKGHSLYPESKVVGLGTDGNKKETVFVGTTEDPVKLNGKTYNYAYKFTNTNFARPLKKDLPIRFFNQDIGRLPSETVTEQVQAKVTFDLNGGKLQTTVKSFEGYNVVSGQPYKDMDYKVARANDTDNVVRIAPMNTKYSTDKDYVANGFTGANVSLKDHNDKDLEGDALELRKFPEDKPKSSNSEYEFLGWTTQKMIGNATNDFAKLEKATTVEEVNSGKNYIFTDKTPLDKSITVYAAYGKKLAKIVLHRNMNDQDDVVEEIILSEKNFNGGVVNIPDVYYNKANKGEIEKFNADNSGFQDDFLKENTFVGWMLPNKANNGYVENKSYKAGALLTNNGYTQDEFDNKQVAYSQLSESKALPNTFDLKLDKTYDEIIQLGGEIHLYASYRPFYKVELSKQFKKYNKERGVYEDLTQDELKKTHDVKFGLLYRTAVTNWNSPTVLQSANYFTLNPDNLKDTEILKEWKKLKNNQLEWSVPGYDILGQRISYIGVEVPIGQEANYENHSNAEDWSTLGINVYVRIPKEGEPTVQDPKAPFDPLNPIIKLSKSQSVSIKNKDGSVDAFTAATSRKPLGVNTQEQSEKNLTPDEISQINGYHITVTNILVDVEAPKFKGSIYDGQKEFSIYAPKDKDIDKVKITFNRGEHSTTIEAEITPDGITGATPGGNQEAFKYEKDKDGDYVIKIANPDWSFKEKDKITAQFFKGTAPSEITPAEVQPKQDANKIKEITQVPFKEIKDGDGHGTGEYDTSKVQVQVVIPNPTPGAPGNGSEFTPGIVDESGKFTPIEGVKPIVVDKDTRPGDKVTVDIPRDKLKHGDKIAFKSEEPYKTTVTPDGKDQGFGYLVVDLEGPKVNKSELKDDYFRMFADLTAELDELPEGGSVKIIVGKKEQTFETKEKAIEYLRAVERSVTKDNMPEVKIVLLDASNNKTETTVDYKREEQIDITLMDVIAGDDTIKVLTTQGAKLTVKVMSNGKQVASAEVDSATNGINSITLWDTNLAQYKLKEDDIIIIEATKDGARANPLVYFVQ